MHTSSLHADSSSALTTKCTVFQEIQKEKSRREHTNNGSTVCFWTLQWSLQFIRCNDFTQRAFHFAQKVMLTQIRTIAVNIIAETTEI